MRDFESNIKNLVIVPIQSLAHSAASANAICLEAKGARRLKIRVLASGVAAGKTAVVVLKGGDTWATRATNTIETFTATADASGYIDYEGYVTDPAKVYQYLTAIITPAADAGDSGYYAVDVLFGLTRYAQNIVVQEKYS